MLKRLLARICARPVSMQAQQSRRSSCMYTPPCCWSALPNGVRVITEQTAAPLACVSVIAEAGSRYEIECNNGASHFFELMAFRGVQNYSRCYFQEYVREMGAYMTAHTDREYQIFTCLCPQTCVMIIINLFSLMFRQLDLDYIEIECARIDAYGQLKEIDANQKLLTYDYLHQTAFQGTTLARAPVGCSANYDKFDAWFLREFVAQHYQPNRLILSVSSCFNHFDISSMINSNFGCLKLCPTNIVEWPCRFTGSMLRFRDDTLPFCHVAMAVECGGYNSDDFVTLQLIKHVIGRWDESQQNGYNTWPMLAHACALSKLCYSYKAIYLPYKDVGLWGVYFVIRKEDDYEDPIIMIQDQWMVLATSITSGDVERAKCSLKLELANARNGCMASCRDMGLSLMYTGYRKHLSYLFKEIDSIKYTEVRDFCSDLLYDRCPAVSAVGPTEAMPEYNRVRAGMRWLRL